MQHLMEQRYACINDLDDRVLMLQLKELLLSRLIILLECHATLYASIESIYNYKLSRICKSSLILLEEYLQHEVVLHILDSIHSSTRTPSPRLVVYLTFAENFSKKNTPTTDLGQNNGILSNRRGVTQETIFRVCTDSIHIMLLGSNTSNNYGIGHINIQS